MNERVICYSGSRYAERPTAFHWVGERQAVADILAEWHTPEGYAFRVRTVNDLHFELNYCEESGEWQIKRLDIHQ